MTRCENPDWQEFTQESFDSEDCSCSNLDNHTFCPVHGIPPHGGQLREKHLYHECNCTPVRGIHAIFCPENSRNKGERMSETIDITPNYSAIFSRMLEVGISEAEQFTHNTKNKLEAARAVHRVLAPLNVALQSATSVGHIEAMRLQLSDVVGKLNDAVMKADNDD
jgi:hypothetical protein